MQSYFFVIRKFVIRDILIARRKHPKSYLYIGLTSKLNAENMFLSFQPYFTLFFQTANKNIAKHSTNIAKIFGYIAQ